MMILSPTRELAVQILAEVEDHCQGIIALVTLSARASWYTLMDASVIVATPEAFLRPKRSRLQLSGQGILLTCSWLF